MSNETINYETRQLAKFIKKAEFSDINQRIIEQLKKHLLDSIGSMLHCTSKPSIQKLCRLISNMGEGGRCQAPVVGKVAPDRAAQLFTAMIRYPDFMDNFLGKEATCHPSDNIGALLAAAQLKEISGADFLLAMALGYEIECRLVEEIPVMIKGFDHTVLLAYSLTAALCKILDLEEEQIAHALAIAGCSINPLVTCRASYTYEWKGFASSLVALECINIVLLAKEDMTGPVSLFEGPKGFKDVFEMELQYDWKQEDFSLIRKCALKAFNSEVHTQSTLEAALQLKKENNFLVEDIDSIEVTTFLTAYHIVGGGSYGDRKKVLSKEQADHSLPYVLAVALLDGKVYPEQLTKERIIRADVQALLQKIKVNTSSSIHKPVILAGILDPYTEAYPEKLSSKVEITFRNKEKIECKKEDYHGYYTRPMDWSDVEKKFKELTKQLPFEHQQNIIEMTGSLEKREMGEFISQLTKPQRIMERV
jgi:2-methylcitrate dehydratase